MTILSISNESKKATITLDASELAKLCNVLCKAPEDQKTDIYYKLHSDLMIAGDLTQYGHLDDFCLSKVVEYRRMMEVSV